MSRDQIPVKFEISRAWYAANRFQVIAVNSADELLGSGAVELMGSVARVRSAHVLAGLERHGIGTMMYEKMAEVAKDHGCETFCSGTTLSLASRGFWEKQVRKGRAEVRFVDGKTAYCLRLGDNINFSGARTKRRKK